MTNEEFTKLLGMLRSLSGGRDRVATTQLVEHARKLVALSEAAKAVLADTDSLSALDTLASALAQLEDAPLDGCKGGEDAPSYNSGCKKENKK